MYPDLHHSVVCVEKEEASLNLLSVIDFIIFALPIFGVTDTHFLLF